MPSVTLFENDPNVKDYEKGYRFFSAGDPGDVMYVVIDGEVDLELRGAQLERVGHGGFFGEMALLDGGKRSADIVADERVICYVLAVEQLQELAATHPHIMITILGNLTRDFSERLRHANEEISALA